MTLNRVVVVALLAACGGRSEPSPCERAARGAFTLIPDPGKRANEDATETWRGFLASECKQARWSDEAIACFAGTAPFDACPELLNEKQRRSFDSDISQGAQQIRDGMFIVTMTTAARKTYRIPHGDKALDVTFDIPADWRDQSTERGVVLNTMRGAWFKISSTCHGVCGDATQLATNIKTVAQERFDFTKSDGFIDDVVPAWDQVVVERSPGVFEYQFHGLIPGKPKFRYTSATLDRIVDGHVLHCTVELLAADLPLLPGLLERCRTLQIASAPKS